jgi:hypothetical protein
MMTIRLRITAWLVRLKIKSMTLTILGKLTKLLARVMRQIVKASSANPSRINPKSLTNRTKTISSRAARPSKIRIQGSMVVKA